MNKKQLLELVARAESATELLAHRNTELSNKNRSLWKEIIAYRKLHLGTTAWGYGCPICGLAAYEGDYLKHECGVE